MHASFATGNASQNNARATNARVYYMYVSIDERDWWLRIQELKWANQDRFPDLRFNALSLTLQVGQLKLELNKKSSDVQALQTKIESLTHQQHDYQAHVSLLKESLAAKEQHSSILQADVSSIWRNTLFKLHEACEQFFTIYAYV